MPSQLGIDHSPSTPVHIELFPLVLNAKSGFRHLVDFLSPLAVVSALAVLDDGADGVQHPHAVLFQLLVRVEGDEVLRLDLGVRREEAAVTTLVIAFVT